MVTLFCFHVFIRIIPSLFLSTFVYYCCLILSFHTHANTPLHFSLPHYLSLTHARTNTHLISLSHYVSPTHTLISSFSFSDLAILFVDACKLSPSVIAYLTEAGVSTLPYNDAIQYVRNMSENEKLLDGKKIWCDGKTVNFAMFNSVKSNIRIDKESPVTIMKSTKNEVRELVN
jgi:Creatinase/Prolidase N-terminal domain